nr:MAG: septal ring lytic transglycosylase RlpA family lipoprotein [Pseudomonadota bacterium]
MALRHRVGPARLSLAVFLSLAAPVSLVTLVASSCARPPEEGAHYPAAPAPGTGPAYGEAPPAAGISGREAASAWAKRYANARPLVQFSGVASYYSDKLAGRKTANGERYDPRALTAAHRSLPFGTIVRVIREDTRRAVYVRINDRGPYRKGRVIDLSRAAAEELAMIRSGLAKVRAEVVELGNGAKVRRRR